VGNKDQFNGRLREAICAVMRLGTK